VEDGVGAGLVGVLEEGKVDEAGAVFEGDEDDALAGGEGRGLSRGADTGDQDLLPGAQRCEVGGVGGADFAQEAVVVVRQVLRDIDLEDLQLGTEGFAGRHLRQPGRTGGGRESVEEQLTLGLAGAGLVMDPSKIH
jgi:hypothetical protein